MDKDQMQIYYYITVICSFFLSLIHWLIHSRHGRTLSISHPAPRYSEAVALAFPQTHRAPLQAPGEALHNLQAAGGYDGNPRDRHGQLGLTFRPRN